MNPADLVTANISAKFAFDKMHRAGKNVALDMCVKTGALYLSYTKPSIKVPNTFENCGKDTIPQPLGTNDVRIMASVNGVLGL